MTSPRDSASGVPGKAGRPWIVPGAVFVLGYTLMNAGKSVFEGHVLVSLTPAFIAFNCFVLAQIVYIGLHRDRKGLINRVRAHPGKVLIINLTTLLSWLAVLYALASLEPVVVNGIVVGAIPLVTLALAPWLRPAVPIVTAEKIAAFGCSASVIALTIVSMRGLSGLGALPPVVVVTGLIAALLTAFGVATNTYATRALTDAQFTSADIMSLRFTLLNIAAAGILFTQGGWTPYTGEVLAIILVLTVVGVFLGIYWLQIGIARTEPMTVSLLFATNLIFTFIVQLLDPRIAVSWSSFSAILVLTAFTIYGTRAAFVDRARPA